MTTAMHWLHEDVWRGFLAASLLSGAVAIALTAVLAYFAPTGVARRRAWRWVTVALVGLLLWEGTGLATWGRHHVAPAASWLGELGGTTNHPDAGAVMDTVKAAPLPGREPPLAAVSLLVPGVWVLGCLALWSRLAVSAWLLRRRQKRLQICVAAETLAMVEDLRAQLRVGRPLRVGYARLHGPLVFGTLRPTLVLPEHFETSFDEGQRRAILLHELGHLSGSDPAWHWWTEFVVALWWWHPLVWWARARLREANEAAADEATLLVAGGPLLLAESLVKLGRVLSRPGAGFAVAGLASRSSLARRIRTLLHLRPDTGRASPRVRAAWLGCILATLASTLVLIPQAGGSASAWTNCWRKSVLGVTVATLKNADAANAGPELEQANLRVFAPLGFIRGPVDGDVMIAERIPSGGQMTFREVLPGLAKPVAPRMRVPVKGQGTTAGAQFSEEIILGQLGLTDEQRQRFDALQTKMQQASQEMRRLETGHVEKGREINRWWVSGLQEIFTPEQYQRYQDYWREVPSWMLVAEPSR